MPPDFLTTVTNWGPLAVILFGILYRVDQTARALLPVVIEHFKKLGEAMDAMRAAIANLTTLTETVGAIGSRLDEGITDGRGDHADLSDGIREANAGIKELLTRVPARHESEEKEIA